ncbi:MAG: hypothetical protein GQ550_07665 [Gammaproteobacteria bacterium]|nr:hypothetical protein [Gammaproteobacteria bacterium]
MACSVITPLQAAFDERYELIIGYSVTDYNSKIRINSRDNSIDKEIDFEDVLGFDTTVQLGWVRGSWRMADRHRLALLYMPIKRTSLVTTQKDIDIGGNIIKSGAFLETEVNTHTFDIEYIYSFYKTPEVEVGVTGGIYWMNSLVEISAAGEVILEGSDQAEFRNDYQSNQRVIAPLPLIGVKAAYEFNQQWRARVSARYLDVTIGDIEGRILNLNLAAEYYFNNNLGLGASLTTFDVSVRQSGVVFINALTYQYNAVQAYLVLKY